MMHKLLAAGAASLMIGLGATASAATVTLSLTNQGTVATAPGSTATVFRADLTGIGLAEIAAIKITDSNSGTGGSPGIYSGFDLDAIFLDIDGDFNTTADQISATAFLFMAGSVRPTLDTMFLPDAQDPGPTSGAIDATTVDEAQATLGAIDGVFFDTGSLTLGDGGMLTAIFGPSVPVGASLFLFIAELGNSPGEGVDATIEVSDVVPEVPLPGAAVLFASGLAALRLRKKKA
ncbi:hypothetical protein [Parvularcula sp. LCG005]|uniref:hypothetical protein n=1 Tax=Parvularcula sp. LCG005 TaxID=3078805 RepID=UPI0029433EFB|nr:hypothetical protein [Parvularcula sp. LCG005]WOI53910.1 hypothetical protein RUI03_02645 [Parvularcula sp. LCG005]